MVDTFFGLPDETRPFANSVGSPVDVQLHLSTGRLHQLLLHIYLNFHDDYLELEI